MTASRRQLVFSLVLVPALSSVVPGRPLLNDVSSFTAARSGFSNTAAARHGLPGVPSLADRPTEPVFPPAQRDPDVRLRKTQTENARLNAGARFGPGQPESARMTDRHNPNADGRFGMVQVSRSWASSGRGNSELSEKASEVRETKTEVMSERKPKRKRVRGVRKGKTGNGKTGPGLQGSGLEDRTELRNAFTQTQSRISRRLETGDDRGEISREFWNEEDGDNNRLFRERTSADSLRSIIGKVPPASKTKDVVYVYADTVIRGWEEKFHAGANEDGEERDEEGGENDGEGSLSGRVDGHGEAEEDKLCICLDRKCMTVYSFIDFCRKEPDVSADCLDAIDYFGLEACQGGND